METSDQARAPATQPFGAEGFGPSEGTVLRWLGMAGFLVNSRGTTIMIDPLLGGFDMPIMIEMPVSAADVPHLDALLVTHSDNDHYSVPTCRDLAEVTESFHSTRYVASLMRQQDLPSVGHDIGDVFHVGPVRIEVTPADHAWQNASPGASTRVFRDEDCCGFWLTTPDGTIWAPGDSRLIPDHHLTRPTPDALIFDFSDSEWHFGLDGAVRSPTPTQPLRSCSTTGVGGRPRLRTLQRRPGLPTRPGGQPRTHPRPRPRRTLHPARSARRPRPLNRPHRRGW